MTVSVPKSKFIIFEWFCAVFQPTEKKKKEWKNKQKTYYFKVHMWGQIVGFIWKKQVKIKQNNVEPTVDLKKKHMISVISSLWLRLHNNPILLEKNITYCYNTCVVKL